MLRLPFVAVVPANTAAEKLRAIESLGGRSHTVEDTGRLYEVAAMLAKEAGGHYMDQFTYAERATDWRGNNIAQSIFLQMAREPAPIPTWIVCGAGTGGTSATIGRYLRYNRYATRLAVADPVGSVYHRHWQDPAIARLEGSCTLVEGIGRPRVEPSFVPSVIDHMEVVADAASIAAARWLSGHLGRRVGGSTGTNFIGCARLAARMAARGEAGSIVSILCDSGDRYASTIFNDGWLSQLGLDIGKEQAMLERFAQTGVYP